MTRIFQHLLVMPTLLLILLPPSMTTLVFFPGLDDSFSYTCYVRTLVPIVFSTDFQTVDSNRQKKNAFVHIFFLGDFLYILIKKYSRFPLHFNQKIFEISHTFFSEKMHLCTFFFRDFLYILIKKIFEISFKFFFWKNAFVHIFFLRFPLYLDY